MCFEDVGPTGKGNYRGGSREGARLGGSTLPELVTVHPLGRPGKAEAARVLVAIVVGVDTHPLGPKEAPEERCVPWKGAGMPGAVVTTGAFSITPDAPGLTFPPTASTDCQVPSVPE